MLESLFYTCTGLRTCNFIKAKLQHWNLLAITAKFFITASFVKHLRSLLLLFITLLAHWFLYECMHLDSADPFGRLSIRILTPDLLINVKYHNFKIIVTLKLRINGFLKEFINSWFPCCHINASGYVNIALDKTFSSNSFSDGNWSNRFSIALYIHFSKVIMERDI